ncbi:MAG: hypothetical protein HC873_19495, partial [Leptolyngbyaceae cyanobacterium SL_1_1]|nr:hypothetical protein [Leptolyngbyaceae cyanobacterium SL_1_1]
MTGLVPPEYQQLLIAGYVLGDLGPEEAAAFEQLLAADPSLIREVEQMQQALEMAYAAETPPPAHLKASILSAYELAQTAVAAPRRSTRVVALSGWIKGLGAIAAALIIGLVIDNYTLRRSLQAVRDVSTPA